MILLQGGQEGQMGFLVSVLAPSDKEGLGDCEGSDRRGPLALASFSTPIQWRGSLRSSGVQGSLLETGFGTRQALWESEIKTGFQAGRQVANHTAPSELRDLVHPFVLLSLSFVICKMRIIS